MGEEGEGYRTVPLTIVRWWLCSLAHAHARPSRTHTNIEPWILSFPPFRDSLYFYPGSLVIYYSQRWLCKRGGGDARRAPVAPSTGKAVVPLLKMEYRSPPSHEPLPPPDSNSRLGSGRSRVLQDGSLDKLGNGGRGVEPREG